MMKNWISKTCAAVFFGLHSAAGPTLADGSSTLPSILPGLPEIKSGVQFCNKSTGDDYLWVAINHYSDGKWLREGWWKVAFDDCATVLAEIDNRYMYYYAHNGSGKVWTGDRRLCTKSSVFTLESGSPCSSKDIRGFKMIDLKDSTSFRMTLN